MKTYNKESVASPSLLWVVEKNLAKTIQIELKSIKLKLKQLKLEPLTPFSISSFDVPSNKILPPKNDPSP